MYLSHVKDIVWEPGLLYRGNILFNSDAIIKIYDNLANLMPVSESDIYWRQILTTKDDPRAVGVNG